MTQLNSNLPVDNRPKTSDQLVNQFFDTYFSKKLEFPTNEVIAVRGFFERRGWSLTAAKAISLVLMQQAKIDNMKVFELLDTLKGFTENQLSELIAEVLNHNRLNTSVLGLKRERDRNSIENRNIVV